MNFNDRLSYYVNKLNRMKSEKNVLSCIIKRLSVNYDMFSNNFRSPQKAIRIK